jgi:uncharacterized protein
MFAQLLTDNLSEVIKTLKMHRVKKAYAFGSVCTNKFNVESDIDFLIDFEEGLDPLEQGEHWWSIQEKLEDMLGRQIDLVSEKSLKNPYFIEELLEKRQLIYG